MFSKIVCANPFMASQYGKRLIFIASVIFVSLKGSCMQKRILEKVELVFNRHNHNDFEIIPLRF